MQLVKWKVSNSIRGKSCGGNLGEAGQTGYRGFEFAWACGPTIDMKILARLGGGLKKAERKIEIKHNY
jgi:hypothetical protein